MNNHSRYGRLLALLLCITMLAGLLAGCGKKEEAPAPETPLPVEDPAQTGPEEDPEFVLPASLTEGGDYRLKAAVVCFG
ncbi:MAG: hypothetical protein HUJ80_04225, partial [Firmicutes bacterium]|nr:hypothetical protein [Bacillota bacterium]